MHSQLFSNETRGFYPVKCLRYYKSVGVLPDDLVRISDDVYENFIGAAPKNCVPNYNAQGQMEWLEVEPPLKTNEEIIDANKLEQKNKLREAVLYAFPLQAAVDVGEATTEQTEILAQIKRYTVDVLNLSLETESPAWPEKPFTTN
ncbi:tail fiber assembly protein [Buttiauxella sp. S19-1]|uniref:tail fiber assembly protein n=1 Tax=Buttiauxella sp. S19-1 TaxID=941430 RepID=UPI001EDC7A71|nr:tail fiber assembly protein [Buttiauxella sp. S19-1]